MAAETAKQKSGGVMAIYRSLSAVKYRKRKSAGEMGNSVSAWRKYHGVMASENWQQPA